MTALSVEQLWNHDFLQPLRESCVNGEIVDANLFLMVNELLCTMEECQGLSEADRKRYAGMLTGRLKGLIPVAVSSSQDTVLDMDALPSPLYQILQFYHNESNSFRKVHRLIDLFEWSIKWHTVLVMSDLLQEADISDEMKVLFSSGLRVPSLGVWMHFFRASMAALNNPSFPWTEWECLLELERKHQIVHFRNGYAHGATPSDEDCEKDCKRLFPVLQKMMVSPIFSQFQMVYADNGTTYRWIADKKIPSTLSIPEGHVCVVHHDQPDKVVLQLWPIGLASVDPKNPERGRQFFYFNALKNKSIEQLNYAWGLHFRDKALWTQFHETIPIAEWKRVSNPELDIFRERVEALTEVFKGRIVEKERLREFCLRGNGNQMVWGPPGIGKSALLAQVFKECRGGVDADGVQLEDSYPTIIPYFIRRGTETALPEKFLRYLCQQLDSVYGLKGMGMGNGTQELSDSLQVRLQAISEQDAPQKLVLFVDGLDEGIEKTISILRFIPTSKPWLSVLCASRQVPEVETWYHQRASRQEFAVQPLSANDIRALLYEVVDKYDEGLSREYIEAVEKVSSGNPLYLKLLCDQLYAGVRRVGSVEDLPKEMSDLYKEVLHRVTEGGRNENAYRLLLLLTETKASLPVEVVSDLLDISEMAAQSAMDDCMELLFEDPITPDVLDYQLFHESLRTYMRETKVKDTRRMAIHVTDVCYSWQRLEGHTLRYALEFLAGHLYDRKDDERIWRLLNDESFRKEQIRVSRQFAFSYESMLVGLKTYVEKEAHSPQDDGRLSWLVLRVGELAREAIEGVGVAFEWFTEDASELNNALKRIEVLNEENYFKACLILVMIAAWRQQDWDESIRDISVPSKILETMDERIPDGTGTVDWSKFISEEFMSWWVILAIETWKDLDLGAVYRRGDSYAVIAKRLAKQGMIEQAITTANTISSERQKSQALADIAKILSEQGMIEKAKEVFTEAITTANTISHDRDKSEALADITKSLAEHGMIEKAITTANTISDDYDKSQALGGIAKILAEQGKIEEAITIVNTISDDRYKSRALADIAKILAEHGMIEKAKKVFAEAITTANTISDKYGKSSSLAYIAKILAEHGMIEKAKKVFAEAITTANTISDKYGKSLALGGIAKILAEQGKIEEAITIVNTISDDRYKPQALADIAKILAEQGMIEKAITTTNTIYDFSEQSESLAYIAKILAEHGMIEKAITTANTIANTLSSDYKTKSRALADIAKILAEQGMIKKAITTANTISDDWFKSWALADIAKILAEQGMIEKAKKVFAEAITTTNTISHDFDKPQALAYIAEILAEHGMIEQAITTANTISRDWHKSWALVYIANSLAEHGMIEKAKKVFTEAITTANTIYDFSEKSQTLAYIAKSLAEQGMIEKAITTANTISRDGHKSWALADIAKILAEHGMIEKAKKVFAEAITTANTISHDWHKSWALADIVKILAEQGMIEKAITTTNTISNDFFKSTALAYIAKSLAEQGMIEKAITTANTIPYDGDKPRALADIAKILAEQGMIEKAITTANTISDDYDKSQALADIAKILAEQGMIEQAQEVFKEAITTANTIANTISRDSFESRYIADIAKILAEYGMIEESKEVFADAITTANTISDHGEKSKVLVYIAKSIAKQGMIEETKEVFKEAITTANNISDDEFKSKFLADIAKILAAQDRSSLLHQHLVTSSYSALLYESFLPNYQQTLTDTQLLRASFLFSPFSYTLSQSSVYRFLNHHLRSDDKAYMQAIIEHCPQLELDCMLPSTPTVPYTYATWRDWIDTIEDEDDQDTIRIWASKVRKGKMAELTFDEKVQALLG